MSDRPDRQLVRGLRRRDEEAFTEMVRSYQHRVFNIVYRILGDRAESEEVAQEVFIAVFKHIDGFRGDSKFSTWLFRIATNRAKNRAKYRARRNRDRHRDIDDTPASEVDQNPVGGETDRPDREAMGRELESVVQDGLETLNEKHRTAIVLCDIEDLSYAEMADVLEVAEGTVKSRLYRARRQLKEFIDEHYHSEGGIDEH